MSGPDAGEICLGGVKAEKQSTANAIDPTNEVISRRQACWKNLAIVPNRGFSDGILPTRSGFGYPGLLDTESFEVENLR